MDVLGYVCLLVVAVLVIVLIVLNRKRSDTETFETRTVVKDPPEKQTTEMPLQPCNQKTIYEFIQTDTVVTCPCCDGEIASAERFCMICGQDLTKEGV